NSATNRLAADGNRNLQGWKRALCINGPRKCCCRYRYCEKCISSDYSGRKSRMGTRAGSKWIETLHRKRSIERCLSYRCKIAQGITPHQSRRWPVGYRDYFQGMTAAQAVRPCLAAGVIRISFV